MRHLKRRAIIAAGVASALSLSASGVAHADAIVGLLGPDSNQGALDLAWGSYSLWGLLGGSTTTTTTTNASGTIITYGAITTTTPTGDNSKNATLRDYLVVTDSSGLTSVVSLGEIDPMFAGTANSNAIGLAVSGSTASLTFLGAGASGRDLSNVTSIQLLAAPALPGPLNPAPQSTAATLSGNVKQPGSYTLSQLQSDFTPTSETVSGDTYTGVPLWIFLDPSSNDILDQYVITAGTDGYEVVLPLAELDPSLGGDPGDLLPYADTNGTFPGAGVARTILPSDQAFAHGRWESNLATVEVNSVPKPGSLALLVSGLVGMVACRRKRRS